MQELNNPKAIEARSFEIIERYLNGIKVPHRARPIVTRVIHATADTGYARRLVFHPRAIRAGIDAVKKGKVIVVDANMVKAGINKRLLKIFGSRVVCRLDSKRVAKESLAVSVTRAGLAIRNSVPWMDGGIIAIGNAPTALFELCRLIKEKKARPSLVVGVPVGFVGAQQAKRLLRASGIPSITNKGRRGGSACAVAIINALLIMACRESGRL